jgi:hypothetical protein
MINQKSNFTSYLEWESFDWDIILYNIESQNKYYKIPSNSQITVFRNNEYKLAGKLKVDTEEKVDLQYYQDNLKPIAGQILKGDTIIGTDINKIIRYELRNFYIRDISTKYSGFSPKIITHTEADILFYEIEEIMSTAEPNSIYEFYLSGYTNITFPRITDRTKIERVKKIRNTVDKDKVDDNISFQSEGGSSDFFFVETPDFDLIVQKVNDEFLPDWANGFQIEYRKTFKVVPDVEIRKAVSEIVGFVLGTHLLKVGETHFDQKNRITKRIAFTPWGDNIISKSQSIATPPVSFKNIIDWQKIERVLSKLIPVYLEKRNELGLDDVLWKYWISKELAIGTNLPILASALESLAENYIEANSLTLTYTDDEKKTYKSLVEEDKNSLAKKIDKYDFKDRVINFINNPFDLSGGQKLKLFLSSISIKLTNKSIENQAIRARNKMVHSSIDNSDKASEKYIDLTGAYRTLMNRVILKVLDYDETYVDYFTKEFPERKIDENIEIP